MPKEITGWEKWELEFEKFVDESLNGYAKWYPEADPITVQKFISQAIASAVEARENQIASAVRKMSDGQEHETNEHYLGFEEAIDKILSIINPSKE